LPLFGLLARSSFLVVAGAIVGTVFTGAGMLISEWGSDHQIYLMNRGMSAVLVWVVASMSLRHLYIGNKLQQQLIRQASTDSLTGLYNRRHVFDNVKNELRRYERYGDCFSLILIDADKFKSVNDSYGHVAGDATLRWIACVCKDAVRETDVVGRFGGEEFIVLLPHTTATEAAVVAERIRRAMHAGGSNSPHDVVPVTLSLGVAEVGPDVATFDDILKASDEALYAAKHAGRDRVITRTSGGSKPQEADVA
jgi:diguanylate cyclase (GGDEF)-like protein